VLVIEVKQVNLIIETSDYLC